jgi:hypothetical protein
MSSCERIAIAIAIAIAHRPAGLDARLSTVGHLDELRTRLITSLLELRSSH